MTTDLISFWSADRQDHFTASSAAGKAAAVDAGYQRLRIESEVFPTQLPGTVPLRLFYSEARGDNFTTATRVGMDDALAAGYREVLGQIEGYIYASQAGARCKPLVLYWHEGRGDNFLTGHSDSAAAAVAAGYRKVRIEGYAPVTNID